MKTLSRYQREHGQLLLVRHAESCWNAEQRFTGWVDVPLSQAGRTQARATGRAIAATGIAIGAAFVSRLQRAKATLVLLQQELPGHALPVTTAWELNERHYGSLQGAYRLIVSAEQGEDKLARWRRGYAERPPQLSRSDPAHPVHDPLYADVNPERLPSGESLQETRHRVAAYFTRMIRPQLLAGRNVLVVAHGNTLRALVMELEMLTVPEVEALEIGMAEYRSYRFDTDFEIVDKAVHDIRSADTTDTQAA